MTVSAPGPFATEQSLLTPDGVRLRAGLAPGPGGHTAIVLVHGFNARINKAANLQVLGVLAESFPVIAVELRGHGDSEGECTLGDKEIHDVTAAVQWARELGFRSVATVGFSMGASVVVRHAGLVGGVEGVVAVSGPAFWNYRGTPVMRRLHFGVEHPVGRLVVRHVLGTRVIPPPWPQPWPLAPVEAARRIPPLPFLIVHGTQDAFFPQEHPDALRRAAAQGAAELGVPDRTELWLRPFGHAEAAIPAEVLGDITKWWSAQAP